MIRFLDTIQLTHYFISRRSLCITSCQIYHVFNLNDKTPVNIFSSSDYSCVFFFFFQAEDGIRDHCVTGVQTCALPICLASPRCLNAPSTSSVKPAGAETMPRKLPSWLAKMNTPSAAVKPITTELDMKFTSEPNRRRPSASMMIPDISASVSASWM